MEWASKLIQWLKIPIKVLLPTLWVFSGILLFLNDQVLSKIYLLKWRNDNGFIIGLIFTISSCLIFIYTISFILNLSYYYLRHFTRHRRYMKRLLKLNDTELEIIRYLYSSHGYTNSLDYSDPVVKGLIARKFLYAGNNIMITPNIWDNSYPIKVTLQPFVIESFEYYLTKASNKVKKLEEQRLKTNNESKRKRISEKIQQYKIDI